MSRTGSIAVSVATLAALLMSGCATPADAGAETPKMWQAQMEQVLARDSAEVTEVHREILADYAISEAEYAELRQQLSDCLSRHGIEHELEPAQGGSLQTTALAGDDDGSETRELATSCIDSTTGPIEGIYEGMRRNPEGLSQGEVMRRCLDESGATEFAGVPAAELERRIKAVELEPTTPEAMVCQLDPFGTEGLTPAAAAELVDDDQGGSDQE